MAECRPFPVGLGAFAVEVVFPSGRVEVVRRIPDRGGGVGLDCDTRHVEGREAGEVVTGAGVAGVVLRRGLMSRATNVGGDCQSIRAPLAARPLRMRYGISSVSTADAGTNSPASWSIGGRAARWRQHGDVGRMPALSLDANDVPAVRAILAKFPQLRVPVGEPRVDSNHPRVKQMQEMLSPKDYSKVCDLVVIQNDWESGHPQVVTRHLEPRPDSQPARETTSSEGGYRGKTLRW